MTKADAAEFNKELDKIKFASSFDEAVQKFYDLCSKLRVNIADIWTFSWRKQNIIWLSLNTRILEKHVYTTNSVESINSLVEKIRIRSGGYFNSVEYWKLTYITEGELEADKMEKTYQW